MTILIIAHGNKFCAMLDYLKPQVVLVYGPMNKKIFEGLSGKTRFVQFDDWTTRQHKYVAMKVP